MFDDATFMAFMFGEIEKEAEEKRKKEEAERKAREEQRAHEHDYLKDYFG